MPVWTDPSTHIFANLEQVTATTLDTFVQQNIASLGSYAAATRYFNLGASGLTATSKTAFGGAQSAIATFPEAFTMIVKVFATAVATVSAGTVTFGVYDETGSAEIGYPSTQPMYVGANVAAAYWVGKKQYAASGSAGFTLNYSVASGITLTATAFAVEVTFVRGAV